MHVYLGFTRSNNVLKLNTEFLLQIFCIIKNTIANHMNMKKDQSHTTQIISWGKLTAKNPTIFYYIFNMEHETITYKTLLTRALQYSTNYLTLSYAKLTNT